MPTIALLYDERCTQKQKRKRGMSLTFLFDIPQLKFIQPVKDVNMEKVIKHYPHPTGLALAITSGIVYTICAIAIWLWREQTVRFLTTWFHGIDLTKIISDTPITLGVFFIGLIGVMLSAYIFGFIYAWLYNKCTEHCKKKGWIS